MHKLSSLSFPECRKIVILVVDKLHVWDAFVENLTGYQACFYCGGFSGCQYRYIKLGAQSMNEQHVIMVPWLIRTRRNAHLSNSECDTVKGKPLAHGCEKRIRFRIGCGFRILLKRVQVSEAWPLGNPRLTFWLPPTAPSQVVLAAQFCQNVLGLEGQQDLETPAPNYGRRKLTPRQHCPCVFHSCISLHEKYINSCCLSHGGFLLIQTCSVCFALFVFIFQECMPFSIVEIFPENTVSFISSESFKWSRSSYFPGCHHV